MRKPAVHILVILLLGYLVYSNTFSVPFTWDDDRFIVANPHVRDTSYPIESLKKEYELYMHHKIRPLGMATFALNYRMFGFQVSGFHAFNLLVHLLNALLVYVLVILSFKTPFLRSSPAGKNTGIVALIAALLFVSHPLQTEAVTYIFQRLVPLATLAYLLSLVMYLRARLLWQAPGAVATTAKNKDKSGQGWVAGAWYLGALSAAIAGMYTKEIAFTLPATITLFELCFFEKRNAKQIVALVPFWLTALIIPYQYIFSLSRSIASATRGDGPIRLDRLDYLLTEFRVIARYLRLLVWPTHQNIDYDFPLYRSILNSEVFLSFLLLVVLAGVGVYSYRRSSVKERVWRLAAFGIAWFFITLSIESSILPMYLPICEYRMYLPSIGLFVALSSGLAIAFARLRGGALIALGLCVTLAIALLAGTAYARNALWADPIGFWKQTSEESPRKFVPSYNLAVAYSGHDRIREAINELARTISLSPNYPDAYQLRGELYFKLGAYAEAMKNAQAALALKPDSVNAHTLLGILYDMQGRLPEAIAEFNAAIRIAPNTARPHDELGVVYARQRRYPDAEAEFKAANKNDSDYVRSRINLGILYDEEGRFEEASAELQTALRLDPGSADARKNLGIVQTHMNRRADARSTMTK